MTVADLIAALQEMPSEATVGVLVKSAGRMYTGPVTGTDWRNEVSFNNNDAIALIESKWEPPSDRG